MWWKKKETVKTLPLEDKSTMTFNEAVLVVMNALKEGRVINTPDTNVCNYVVISQDGVYPGYPGYLNYNSDVGMVIDCRVLTKEYIRCLNDEEYKERRMRENERRLQMILDNKKRNDSDLQRVQEELEKLRG